MTTLAMLITALSLGAPASAISVDGQVTKWRNVYAGGIDEIPERAMSTGPNSSVSLRFKSGSMVRLANPTEMTQLVHGATAGKRKERIKILTGNVARIMKLLVEIHISRSLQNTPQPVFAARFWVNTNSQSTQFVMIVIGSSCHCGQRVLQVLEPVSIGDDGSTKTPNF